MQPVVTVRLNGSPERLAAAHWATDEAEKRELSLRLLHAWPRLAPEPTIVPSQAAIHHARRPVAVIPHD